MLPSENQIQLILYQILHISPLKTHRSLLAWLKPSYRQLSRVLSTHSTHQINRMVSAWFTNRLPVTPSTRAWYRGGCNKLQLEHTFQRSTLPTIQTIWGKRQSNINLNPVAPLSRLKEQSLLVPGMPINLPSFPMVTKQFIGGRIALFYQFWQEMTIDPWVLETVLGYRINFSPNKFLY